MCPSFTCKLIVYAVCWHRSELAAVLDLRMCIDLCWLVVRFGMTFCGRQLNVKIQWLTTNFFFFGLLLVVLYSSVSSSWFTLLHNYIIHHTASSPAEKYCGHKNEGHLYREPRAIKGSPFEAWVGQNIPLHASPTAGNSPNFFLPGPINFTFSRSSH